MQREARGGRRTAAQQTQLDQLTRPNEIPLWDLLKLERYAELDAELSHLRAAYPRWSPPVRMLALQREGAARQQITEAVDTKDWASVEALARQYPEQFNCNQINFMWGLAEAHHALGQTERTIAVYERIIPACPKVADRITTLQKASNMVTLEVYAELLQREARGGKRAAAQQSQLGQMTYEFQLLQLLQAIQLKDRPRAIALIGTIDRMPKAQRDSRYANSAGWFYLGAGEDESAITWFETALNWRPASEGSEDARHGLALAKFRMSRRDGAQAARLSAKTLDEAEAALARADPDDERNRALLGEILFARAVDAFNGKEYGQSLAYLQQAEAYGRSGRDVAMMHAWIYYQRGEDRRAADTFIELYRAQPDKESADGAVLSLSRSERWAELSQLSRSLGGPLRERAGLPFSDRHYYQKLFVAAEAAAPGDFAELDNIATPSLTTGLTLRSKSGNDGTSSLSMLRVPVMEGAVVLNGTHELRLQVDGIELSSGNVPQLTPLGSGIFAGPPVTVVKAPTTSLSGFEPYLSYQHQGSLTVYGGIGLTPSGAAIASAPVGNLGFTQQAGRGNWGVELFSQPMRDSILSYTGIVNPFTGKSWGRVRRTGGLIRGYAAISDQWAASGRLRVQTFRGVDVINNQGAGLSLSLARTLSFPGFDYLTVGPDISIDTHDKNLSGFTIGNGGYFSPKRLTSLGLSANMQTAEARQYSIKGSFSLGFFNKREEAGICFPTLGVSVPVCDTPANSASGVYYSGQLLGALRIADSLQIGGGFIYGTNPNYSDKSAVLFLRYLFYPRPAVMSTDLPESMFQRLY